MFLDPNKALYQTSTTRCSSPPKRLLGLRTETLTGSDRSRLHKQLTSSFESTVLKPFDYATTRFPLPPAKLSNAPVRPLTLPPWLHSQFRQAFCLPTYPAFTLNNMQQQQHHNSEEAFAVPAAMASAPLQEQQQQGVSHDFTAAFNDDHIFNIDEDAMLSSVPSSTAALTSLSSTMTTVVGSADDFFSSPEWTDPSPALTSSMSFNMDSCDPSPLLADVHEAPDLSGMPLFGDQLQFSFLQAAQKSQQNNVVGSQTLHNTPTSAPTVADKRSPQLAFNRIKKDNEQSALLLLRAFNSQALINNVPGLDRDGETQATASPAAILSPLPSAATVSEAVERKSSLSSSSRGTKRRIDATDLLPLDAPIQSRTYKTPSATSRKSSSSSVEQVPATPEVDATSGDPLTAKRLSNTLAARRSRHRKAEELRQLHETIEDLQAQVEMWKRRCVRAEQERDDAFVQA